MSVCHRGVTEPMTDTKLMSEDTDVPGRQLTSTYIRWGGLAAMLGPLLVLVANMYGVWREFGSGPDGIVEAATSMPYIVFGGARLLGGTFLVFGLVALYAYQLEAAGKLGVVGFVVSMIGTVLLAGSAWYQLFIVPAMAAEVPAFAEAARAVQAGQWLLVGMIIPVLAQVIGFVIFGIATYRARVFPRLTAVGLVIGALLMFVPIHFVSPVVLLLTVASMGFLLFTGQLEPPVQKPDSNRPQSESIGS